MKLKKCIVIFLCLSAAVAAKLITQTPDSVVEEVAEAIIETELGLPAGSIDVSPENEQQ